MKSLEYKSSPNTAVSNIPSVFIKCEHAPSTHEKQIIKTKHERTDLGIVFRWDSQWKFIRHISHYVQLQLCYIAMKPHQTPSPNTHTHTHTNSVNQFYLPTKESQNSTCHLITPIIWLQLFCNLILLALSLAHEK